ncbi:hypothetical protein M758_6G120800 [Ceratodon purpureus]|nr:hypothetical protein M758_6G120800 [Ceratodon purpureus]
MQYSIGHRWCQGFKILASQSIKGNNEHCSKSQLQQASNFSSTCKACNGDQHLHHNLRGESATLYLCDEGFKRARSECDGGLSGFRDWVVWIIVAQILQNPTRVPLIELHTLPGAEAESILEEETCDRTMQNIDKWVSGLRNLECQLGVEFPTCHPSSRFCYHKYERNWLSPRCYHFAD